ncbi:phage virion morphogenesis protein [uncultured Bacteroides sp.]|jgi:phage gpG-like protein|uniref:phage virion morphogenesis protein n=1 Tax=uncultured Bacteroides sp. TaxID=162156 RepID=UPI00280C2623|nr:phage virion morphogenesis protein [uncultured Bacteroides sp.]
MAEKSNQVTREFQRRINLLVRETLKDIRTEALEEFDRNFEREAFFNQKWARRKFNDDRSRGLLVKTGNLRRSITGRITSRDSVVIETTEPYAQIHNEGGTITVTRKMKKYFWWKYITITGSKRMKAGIPVTYSERFSRKKDGTLRNTKRNRALTEEAEFYRRMAMKKTGSKITIPKRQFIGNHPDLEKLLKEIFYNNAKNFDTL